MAVVSGHGSTLAFTTESAYAPGYTSIGGWGVSRESLPLGHLGTVGNFTYVGGDLYTIEPFECAMFVDIELIEGAEAQSPDTILFESGVGASAGAVHTTDTCTVTYPNTNAGSASGASHVTGWSIGDLVTDTLMTGSISVQWNDWPVFSDGEA